jgi:2-oxoglutarate ferredoxin oxidoreductase subunit alpha
MSHGDTNFILLFPGSVNECFEFGWKAFDIAERIQTPVIVLSDLDLGMNQWMTEPFQYPETPMDRGKVLWEKDLEAMIANNGGKWGRYLDVDGDGIPYRTVPGNRHPAAAYFTRGTGHDPYAKYTEEPEVWEANLNRLAKKYVTAKQFVPKPVLQTMDGAKVGIIAVGSADPSVEEARLFLAQEGVPTDYLRVRAVPFTDDVEQFIRDHEKTYVVELNRDGQLRQILTVNMPEDLHPRLRKVAHSDGMPLSPRWIKEEILALESGAQSKNLTAEQIPARQAGLQMLGEEE